MTSFILQETINFAKEHNSKLYACFLDVRQAFDRVSHAILLLKLAKTGIDISIFKVIVNMFDNVYSCVKTQGTNIGLAPNQPRYAAGAGNQPKIVYPLYKRSNELFRTS